MRLSQQKRICLQHMGIPRWQLRSDDIDQSALSYYGSSRSLTAAKVLLVIPLSDCQYLTFMQRFISDILLYLYPSSMDYCVVWQQAGLTDAEAEHHTVNEVLMTVQPDYILGLGQGTLHAMQQAESAVLIETISLQTLVTEPIQKKQVLKDVQSGAISRIESQ